LQETNINSNNNIKPSPKEKTPMKISVHYISLVKTYTNKNQDTITVNEKAQLSDLLDKIAQKYGKPFKEVYDIEKKEMKSTFVAMINGVLMDQLKGMQSPLKEGDSIILMSLMTGG
jgi:molybdopterin converting factor small subunit